MDYPRTGPPGSRDALVRAATAACDLLHACVVHVIPRSCDIVALPVRSQANARLRFRISAPDGS